MQQQLAEEQKQKQRQLTMQQLPIKVETEAEAEAMSQQIYGEQMVSLWEAMVSEDLWNSKYYWQNWREDCGMNYQRMRR